MLLNAFTEHLPPALYVFFRAGKEAKVYGDPWEWGCLGKVEGFTRFERFLISSLHWVLIRRRGRSVTLIGYDDKNMPTPTLEVVKAMTRAATVEGFKSLEFDRLTGREPHRLVFTVNREGKVTMARKPSKHGIIPASAGMTPDLKLIKKTVKDVFVLAHQGDVGFRGDVETSDETALSTKLASMTLADNEFFLYMVRSGDAAAAGVPLLSTARNPDGSLDVNKLEAGVNKAFAALESGKLQIHDMNEVDNTDKLRELADTITLDGGKEFLGFVRVEN